MSAQLPDSRASNIELTQPTHQEILEQTRLNSNEWKGALSLDAYFRREEHLGRQALIRGGGLTPWALVATEGASRIVLSSCETIRKKALVAENGQIRQVICHGVASVFCPPEYRGKGYAGRMIKDLGEKLQTWQTDGHDCLFSVLYSDIGKQFYAAHQWEPFPSAHLSLPPSSASRHESLPEPRPLYATDLAELCDVDLKLVREKLGKAASSGKTVASIIPNVETLSWHHAREEFVATELYGKTPEVKGAIVGTEEGKRVWCVWMRTWHNTDPEKAKGNTMNILRLVVEDAEHLDFAPASEQGANQVKDSYVCAAIASLLAAAQAEASKWTMGTLEIWNPVSVTLAAARRLDGSAAITHREKDSIASLRWYGQGSVQDVAWMDNEKYAWC